MQILLLSEVFLTTNIINDAFKKINITPNITVMGSSNEAKDALENKCFSVVMIDSYFLGSMYDNWITTFIHFYKEIPFILITYDSNEDEIFKWLDLGFSDIVKNSALDLAISIKREINRIDQIKDSPFNT